MQQFTSKLFKLNTAQMAKLLTNSANRAATRMPEPVGKECRYALLLATLVIDKINESRATNYVTQTDNAISRLMETFAIHLNKISKLDAKLILAACGYSIWVYADRHGLIQISQKMELGNDVFEYTFTDALNYLTEVACRLGEEELSAQYTDYRKV